jgi:hypothetical protein
MCALSCLYIPAKIMKKPESVFQLFEKSMLGTGCWVLDAGFWMLVSRRWFLEAGFLDLDSDWIADGRLVYNGCLFMILHY